MDWTYHGYGSRSTRTVSRGTGAFSGVPKLASALSHRAGRDLWEGGRGRGGEGWRLSPRCRRNGGLSPRRRKSASLRSPDWAGGVPVRRRGKPGDEGGGGRQASPPVAGGRTGVPRLSPRVGRDRGVSKTPPRPAGDGLGSPSSRSTTTNWGRRRR
jgi:hypothetical protein